MITISNAKHQLYAHLHWAVALRNCFIWEWWSCIQYLWTFLEWHLWTIIQYITTLMLFWLQSAPHSNVSICSVDCLGPKHLKKIFQNHWQSKCCLSSGFRTAAVHNRIKSPPQLFLTWLSSSCEIVLFSFRFITNLILPGFVLMASSCLTVKNLYRLYIIYIIIELHSSFWYLVLLECFCSAVFYVYDILCVVYVYGWDENKAPLAFKSKYSLYLPVYKKYILNPIIQYPVQWFPSNDIHFCWSIQDEFFTQ